MTLNILADERLAGLEELIAPLGDLRCVPGRDIGREHLADRDVLLVRSITPVNQALLDDTPVRFVGTATSGVDHIDLDYLRSANIAFAHAGGSNAEAVVDYCLASLAQAVLDDMLPAQGFRVGIVGCGEVGLRLARRLQAMGISIRLCDPFVESALRERGVHPALPLFESLEALADCDVLTLHVPLTRSGAAATEAMIDEAFLRRMSARAVLLNTCRGGVVNEQDLLARLTGPDAPIYAADVWQREPKVDPALVAQACIATPHIAGYSSRAKLEATRMLQARVQEFVVNGEVAQVDALDAWEGQWQVAGNVEPCWPVLNQTLDIKRLSDEFRQAVAQAGAARLTAHDFDAFRQRLQNRREFSECEADTAGMSEARQRFIKAAGFQVAE